MWVETAALYQNDALQVNCQKCRPRPQTDLHPFAEQHMEIEAPAKAAAPFSSAVAVEAFMNNMGYVACRAMNSRSLA
jgi:hypothetical protein